MNQEGVPTKKETIPPQEFLRVKMIIQTGVMKHFLAEGVHDIKKAEAWIDEFSTEFRLLFNTRVNNEEDFFVRAQEHPDEVIKEIADRLESVHRTPQAS